jgi:hypothetical protein
VVGAATVIASLAALLVAAPAGEATFAGRNGHLLWFSGQAPQLWVTGPEGQQARSLPIRPRCGLEGATALFTRSGRQLVVLRTPSVADCFNPFQFAVMLANANGTRTTMLDVLPSLGGLALSPDGRTLAAAYLSIPPGRTVDLVNIYTDSVSLPITVRDATFGPTWLSAHTLLWVLNSSVVETTRTNGTHPHRINIRLPGATPQSPLTIQSVTPSPDGSRLAITAGTRICSPNNLPGCTPTSDIYLVSATGGKAKRLTHSGDAYTPVWSPDGREIAFHDGAANKLLTVANGHVRTLAPRIPYRGVEVVDWQAAP